jgi:hypothetical protein
MDKAEGVQYVLRFIKTLTDTMDWSHSREANRS